MSEVERASAVASSHCVDSVVIVDSRCVRVRISGCCNVGDDRRSVHARWTVSGAGGIGNGRGRVVVSTRTVISRVGRIMEQSVRQCERKADQLIHDFTPYFSKGDYAQSSDGANLASPGEVDGIVVVRL